MWNRNPKNKKEKGLTELQQMKVMYNALMEKIDKIVPTGSLPISELKSGGYGVIPQIEEKAVKKSVWDEEPKNTDKSFQQFLNELPDLETEYEYREKAAEIEASSLPKKQKDLLLMNMRSSKL